MISKLLSFIGGFIAASMVVSATGFLWAGLATAVAASLAKEAYDIFYKKQEANFFDVLAVFAGGLSATFGLFFWL